MGAIPGIGACPHSFPPDSNINCHIDMKVITTLATLIIASGTNALAQESFTRHIQQNEQGKGTVTIDHSPAIDRLVNGLDNRQTDNRETTQTPQTAETHKEKIDKARNEAATKEKKDSTNNTKKDTIRRVERPDTTRHQDKNEPQQTTPRRPETTTDREPDIPVVDMRKKIMRRSYKVTGYRVQAYAGGNTRSDKLRAQQIGEQIKMAYPDVPVYVHFYSPRWICRVGNYRSIEEATRMLGNLRRMGFKQASIVKGKITVQYE